MVELIKKMNEYGINTIQLKDRDNCRLGRVILKEKGLVYDYTFAPRYYRQDEFCL